MADPMRPTPRCWPRPRRRMRGNSWRRCPTVSAPFWANGGCGSPAASGQARGRCAPRHPARSWRFLLLLERATSASTPLRASRVVQNGLEQADAGAPRPWSSPTGWRRAAGRRIAWMDHGRVGREVNPRRPDRRRRPSSPAGRAAVSTRVREGAGRRFAAIVGRSCRCRGEPTETPSAAAPPGARVPRPSEVGQGRARRRDADQRPPPRLALPQASRACRWRLFDCCRRCGGGSRLGYGDRGTWGLAFLCCGPVEPLASVAQRSPTA